MWRHATQLADTGVNALKGYAGLDAEMVDSLVQAGADVGLPVIAALDALRGIGGGELRMGVVQTQEYDNLIRDYPIFQW